MAAIDFPSAPALNDKFPTAPVPGMPTYTWDGEKWTTVTGGTISSPVGVVLPSIILPKMDGPIAIIGADASYALGDHVHPSDTVKADVAYVDAQVATKLGDAPTDGTLYGRKDGSWQAAAITGSYLPLTGGTLTGELTIAAPAFNSNLVMNAPNSTYSNFIYGKRAGLELWRIVPGASTTGDFTVMQFDDAGNLVIGQPPLNIAHTTGQVTVRADPTTALGVATKQYVDASAGGGGGGIEEAPNDGLQYARQSVGWSEVTHQSYSGVQNYMFNATTTPPPAAGGIRLNNATQTAATELYLNYTTNDVNSINLKNYFLQRVKIGDTFYIQDKDVPTKWQLYELISAFTDNSTYATMPVVWRAGASALTAARVIVSREGASVSSPVGEAPNDGIAYVRKNQAWVPEASTVIYMGSFF